MWLVFDWRLAFWISLFWSVQITQCLFFLSAVLSLSLCSRENCTWAFSSCSKQELLLIAVLVSHCYSYSCCGAQALEHRLKKKKKRTQAQYLCCLGLVAPRHVVSSQTRDQTCVPCIGRWILYHWTPREVSVSGFQPSKSQYLSTRILLCLLTVNTLRNKIWGHHRITERSENQERLP